MSLPPMTPQATPRSAALMRFQQHEKQRQAQQQHKHNNNNAKQQQQRQDSQTNNNNPLVRKLPLYDRAPVSYQEHRHHNHYHNNNEREDIQNTPKQIGDFYFIEKETHITEFSRVFIPQGRFCGLWISTQMGWLRASDAKQIFLLPSSSCYSATLSPSYSSSQTTGKDIKKGNTHKGKSKKNSSSSSSTSRRKVLFRWRNASLNFPVPIHATPNLFASSKVCGFLEPSESLLASSRFHEQLNVAHNNNHHNNNNNILVTTFVECRIGSQYLFLPIGDGEDRAFLQPEYYSQTSSSKNIDNNKENLLRSLPMHWSIAPMSSSSSTSSASFTNKNNNSNTSMRNKGTKAFATSPTSSFASDRGNSRNGSPQPVLRDHQHQKRANNNLLPLHNHNNSNNNNTNRHSRSDSLMSATVMSLDLNTSINSSNSGLIYSPPVTSIFPTTEEQDSL